MIMIMINDNVNPVVTFSRNHSDDQATDVGY